MESGSSRILSTMHVSTGHFLVTTDRSIVGGAAIPKFTIVGQVDSFTYNADSGAFTIHQATPIGDATLTTGDKPGAFRLTLVNIPGHPDVKQVVATGVANRPDAIPADFTITYRDGSAVHGSITFTPGKR